MGVAQHVGEVRRVAVVAAVRHARRVERRVPAPVLDEALDAEAAVRGVVIESRSGERAPELGVALDELARVTRVVAGAQRECELVHGFPP